MQEISKQTLLLAAKGDMKAFEEIYRISSGFVYSVAFRVTSSRDAAQDVVQEVFLKLYRNLKGFQFRSSFKTWLYRITASKGFLEGLFSLPKPVYALASILVIGLVTFSLLRLSTSRQKDLAVDYLAEQMSFVFYEEDTNGIGTNIEDYFL